MRRPGLTLAAVVCGAAQLLAQTGSRAPASSAPRAHPQIKTTAKTPEVTPPAQFDATYLGSPINLDKDWLVGVSADPKAAAAEFDDSKWALRDANSSMEKLPGVAVYQRHDKGPHIEVNDNDIDEDETPAPGAKYSWYRIHVKLSPDHGPLALLMQLPVSQTMSMGAMTTNINADVFANGRQITPEGPHGDLTGRYQQISRIYNLDLPPNATSVTLAIRTLYVPFGPWAYTNFFAHRKFILGKHDDLATSLTVWQDRNLFERIPRLVYSISLVVLSTFLLALYFSQKGHVEYLWLALHELVQAPINFIEYAGNSAHLDSLWYAASMMQLVLISAYLFFEFLIAFLALKRRWYIPVLRYTAPILAFVGPLLLMVGHSTAVGILLAIVILGSLTWILGWSLFVFITLIAATIRRNFEAGLLLIPIVLIMVGIIQPVYSASMSQMTGKSMSEPLTFFAGPIPIRFTSIADFAGILAIMLIIFIRFLRIHHDQERASSELAAARSVQELLIPIEKPMTPGFEFDSVYTPANEVGGDFFHVQMLGGGAMLVVIGDVAGKGLKAAMNVSMLMGALRRTPEQSPAKILEGLNGVLMGTDGFTTCQAVWFGANGEVVLASAGHLPPYLNSQEIDVPGGLPLGVLPDVQYEEVKLYLHPGDRLLLLSDGVVEARKSGELFGFDRVRNLCNQTAFYLAEAAREFGQEDDITVLTVRRLAQAMAA
ncbi:MAG TPA: PP2C family protein-serine/threonine phosphatase [Terracidiphilus sp.]|nr:PP2C family protein-serine/threonine phosphatase [Terracidiphilus sp.]